ncbi:AraC family transcriptional regulator [Agrobacterium rhizogenes]|uniref:helix-turn-helix domain-containing protein n=1 Tax=Rhizobium rhizogenes TaxID=359 RepID=UPI001571BF45|nr:AraC family transcriptional regulator [Rhizobium rhizogenes]NTH16734.1 AraC family transcriptional regulator [Rhizobium rhizogenes]
MSYTMMDALGVDTMKMDYGYQSVGLEGDTPFRAFLHGPCEIPFHWHPELEIVFVLRGEINLVVEGQQCLMVQGDLIIINSNVMHNSMAWSSDAIVCGIHVNSEHFDRNGLSGFATREFRCKSFLHSKQFENVAAPIRALISRIVLNHTEHPEEAMVRDILANLLCYFIYRRVPWSQADSTRVGSSNTGRHRVMEIIRKVRGSDMLRLTLGEIAVSEGLTLSHLSRLFKSCVGIGFREYVQNLRLDRAVYELRTTRRNISYVMEDTGFSNPTHFFSKFRDRFGCSPADYRRQQKRSVQPASVAEKDRAEIANLLEANTRGLVDAFSLISSVTAFSSDKLQFSAPHNLHMPAEMTASLR